MKKQQFQPCRRCKECHRPISKPKGNKSGYCSNCYERKRERERSKGGKNESR